VTVGDDDEEVLVRIAAAELMADRIPFRPERLGGPRRDDRRVTAAVRSRFSMIRPSRIGIETRSWRIRRKRGRQIDGVGYARLKHSRRVYGSCRSLRSYPPGMIRTLPGGAGAVTTGADSVTVTVCVAIVSLPAREDVDVLAATL
jgi:hypothetical protein